MAKAVGLGSQFRGRIGNYIGFLTRNRVGRYQQSVKAYQPVVSNPQSFAQCLARVPLGPTQRFYSALQPLISRGFEGYDYGDASKAEFLSYNLANFKGPFVTRDDVTPRPGPFLISRGSLGPITIDLFDGDEYDNYFASDLFLDDDVQFNTMGDLSQSILNSNFNVREGDQITFVWCCLIEGQFEYFWYSFFIDTHNNDAIPAIFWYDNPTDYGLGIDLSVINADCKCYGAAVIRSQAYGDTSFKRSTAFFHLNPKYYHYNDMAAVMAAARSYRDSDAEGDDWTYDPTPVDEQLAYICAVTVTADMLASDADAEFVGRTAMGYVTKGGLTGIFFAYDSVARRNCLIGPDAMTLIRATGLGTHYAYINANYSPQLQYTSQYGTLYV